MCGDGEMTFDITVLTSLTTEQESEGFRKKVYSFRTKIKREGIAPGVNELLNFAIQESQILNKKKDFVRLEFIARHFVLR